MTVSLLVEVPEALHDSLKAFMEQRPDYDQDRAFTAGIALFLLQNGQHSSTAVRSYYDTTLGNRQHHHRKAARAYLDATYGQRGEA